ncbi:MAG: hypothetical protein NVSMB4_07020 [Acidimicrobiales bacterium]
MPTPQSDPSQQWETLGHAASRLQVSVRTLYRKINDGTLPAHRIAGGPIRLRVTDVDALLEPVTR